MALFLWLDLIAINRERVLVQGTALMRGGSQEHSWDCVPLIVCNSLSQYPVTLFATHGAGHFRKSFNSSEIGRRGPLTPE